MAGFIKDSTVIQGGAGRLGGAGAGGGEGGAGRIRRQLQPDQSRPGKLAGKLCLRREE